MLEFIIKKQNIFIYIQLFLFVEYLMTHMFIQFAADHTVNQAFLYLFSVLASSQDLDDQVDHITCLDQTFLDFFLLLLFIQKCGVLSGRDIEYEIYVMLDHLLQTQSLRSAAPQTSRNR